MTNNTYMTAAIMTTLGKFLNKAEVEKHFFLKTSDRAPNKEHCRTAMDLVMEAAEKDREGLVKLAKEMEFSSVHRMMMAATGRPFKDRKSGKNVGGQQLADEIANQVVSELAYFLHKPRPDVKYATCQKGLEADTKIRSIKIKAAPRVTAKKQPTAKKVATS